MDKDTIARLRAEIVNRHASNVDNLDYGRLSRIGVSIIDFTALLSIAERAADVDGLAEAIKQAIIKNNGDAWIDPSRDTDRFTIDGDVDLFGVSATLSRYVLGGE